MELNFALGRGEVTSRSSVTIGTLDSLIRDDESCAASLIILAGRLKPN